MKALIAITAVVASAAMSIVQPPGDPAAFEEIPLREVGLDDAIREFENICLATSFDPSRFDAAIRVSRWRFVTERRADSPSQDRRRSPEAAVIFNQPPIPIARGFGLPQCNFDSATLQVESRETIYTAVEAALQRTTGSVPRRLVADGSTCWRWASSGDALPRLCLMHWRDMDPQQITLSFQFWTPEMERRAGLIPGSEAPQ